MEPYQVKIYKLFANASGMEYTLGATQPGIENSLAEKDLKTLEVFRNLSDSLSQQCVLAAKDQLYLGLQQQKCSQQIRASDSSLLFEALGDSP